MANTTGSKLYLLSALAFFLLSAAGPKKKVPVTIRLTESHSWCGGAELSPESMKEISKPVISPGKKVFIREGASNIVSSALVASGTSDSSGNVLLSLKPGKYCIMDERKSSDKYIKEVFKKLQHGDAYNSPVTMDCLKNWLKTPDLVITVSESGENTFDMIRYIPCSWNTVPCTNYNGPLPP